jgi:hypothetical protein
MATVVSAESSPSCGVVTMCIVQLCEFLDELNYQAPQIPQPQILFHILSLNHRFSLPMTPTEPFDIVKLPRKFQTLPRILQSKPHFTFYFGTLR